MQHFSLDIRYFTFLYRKDIPAGRRKVEHNHTQHFLFYIVQNFVGTQEEDTEVSTGKWRKVQT